MSRLTEKTFRVFCICGAFGFPYGTASTKRIRLLGRCLLSCGIPFHVWHIGPPPFKENKHKAGEYEGITFEYLSPSMRRPSMLSQRALFYLWGCLLLALHLFRNRRRSLIYVYYQGDFIDLLILALCKAMRIPVVQEACEWWPGTASGTYFQAWMYKKIMFKWSNGAIAISQEIRARINSLAGLTYPQCMVPVLVDPSENDARPPESRGVSACPVLLWCGMVDGYAQDVFFLIDAVATLESHDGRRSLLRIVGPCSEGIRDKLLSYAESRGISAARVDIVGYVSDAQLWNYCIEADALLMPLWEDDRSTTRFPTKLGQYLAARRPIVTARVGEVKHFLSDETAMFYPPGDAEGLAASLDRLLSDPALGECLASRAAQEVLPRVDYRVNAPRISKWFYQIYSRGCHAQEQPA